jgi:hypothetical protein
MTISPQTITTPIWYILDNVAPFNIPVYAFFFFAPVNVLIFTFFRASAMTLVGLIYQLIFTFMIVVRTRLFPSHLLRHLKLITPQSIAYAAREVSGLSKKLTLRSLIWLRFASSIGVYFFISVNKLTQSVAHWANVLLSLQLCFSLLSVAFQVDFSRHYGKVGFVIFWMLNWLELSATCVPLLVIINHRLTHHRE